MTPDDLGAAIGPVLDHVPCGIVVASTSAAGQILVVNAEFTAITGYTLADVPTVDCWLDRAYPDPDYRAQVMSNWERDVSEPGRDVFYRVRCADGVDRELLLRAALLSAERMIVTMVDFSGIRRVERELRESEQRFQLIAQNVDQVFWIHGIDPEVMEYVSPAFELVWGRPVEVLYEDPHEWSATVLEEDRPQIDALWAKALAGEAETVDFLYRIRRPDGQLRWLEDHGVAVRDDDGRVIRMVGIAKDVTDRKRAEAAERELEQRMQLAQKMESLGVLAGGVAHDFNNLLVGVLGNADLALADLPAASPVRPSIEAIELAAERAADLARQLLAYSGRGKFVVTRLELNGLVEEMAHLMRAAISKKTQMRFDLDNATAAIEGDASQVRQVVMNLITNASEALGERSGVITIATGTRTFSLADLEVERCLADGVSPGPNSYVEVSDTGVGMDAETQAKIFDPFFTTKRTGRGLGLAAVIGIVKGHHGGIQLRTAPGEGTRFRVLFPVASAAAPAQAKEPPSRRPAQRATSQGTILVVDDEMVVRDVVARYLERVGYAVLLAEDGRVAVETFREQHEAIDCVILDLAMPNLGGQETLRELRRIDPAVRVLLSSGYSEREADERFAGERPAGFLQKPYASAELLAALRRLLA